MPTRRFISVNKMVRYLNAKEAAEIDKFLMGEGNYKLEQLMELAGISCAQAVVRSFPKAKKVLIIAGPGNQGGDGLVAARHLWHFGLRPTLYYPKEGKNEYYQALKQQALDLGVPQLSEAEFDESLQSTDVVLDAIFGFSFKGEVRDPFKTVIAALKRQEGKTPIVSVDIPSAWDVDHGNVADKGFTPDVLVSLTAPKQGSKQFRGRHFLGGRFVTPYIFGKATGLLTRYSALDKNFDLQLPSYPDFDQIVELSRD